jgi:hypothetical protein
MKQAIVTKYLGPTNFHGSRVKATANAGSMIFSWDHALTAAENHRLAASKFADRYSWEGSLIGGGLPDNTGYCWVFSEDK